MNSAASTKKKNMPMSTAPHMKERTASCAPSIAGRRADASCTKKESSLVAVSDPSSISVMAAKTAATPM